MELGALMMLGSDEHLVWEPEDLEGQLDLGVALSYRPTAACQALISISVWPTTTRNTETASAG